MDAVSLLTRGYITPLQRLQQNAASIPLPPGEAQSLLTKALELPLPTGLTEPLGIFQSDVIIRTAIIAAIADLRANPWLLDYVFASLPRDNLTLRDYGEQEVARAKEWFLKTDIKVLLGQRPFDGAPPPVCVSIHLLESAEAENTLGDTHYVPREDVEADWPALSVKFDPVSYNAPTGMMKVPQLIADGVVIVPGMTVIDRHGTAHTIKDVLDGTTLSLEPGTVADFHDCYIKSAKPAYVAHLEGASFKETYAIGCHIVGEPVHLTYLHSIVVFALLRYRQALLEARGFGRSVISSSDFRIDEALQPENVFSRYINLSGYVHQYWPKDIHPKLRAVTQVQVKGVDEDSSFDELESIGTKLE